MQATDLSHDFKNATMQVKTIKINNSVLFPQDDQKDHKQIHILFYIKWFSFVQGLQKRKSEIGSDRTNSSKIKCLKLERGLRG